MKTKTFLNSKSSKVMLKDRSATNVQNSLFTSSTAHVVFAAVIRVVTQRFSPLEALRDDPKRLRPMQFSTDYDKTMNS